MQNILIGEIMKCFIINFNRLTLSKNLADWVASCGIDVFFIDNNSTYEPLLEYYESCPYEVIKLSGNHGHMVFWNTGLYEKYCKGERYILTDPDLDLSGIPKDFLHILEEGLDRYPEYPKCGFSLETLDLPDTEIGRSSKTYEQQYWNVPLDNMYYAAKIDTTFSLNKVSYHTYNAIRTNRPYTAKHVPWYYTSVDEMTDDEKNYFLTCSGTHWAGVVRDQLMK